MPTLRPFRDYDEKDVLNFFAYTGNVIDQAYLIQANKGTICAISGVGFTPSVNEPIQMLGNYGSFNVNNFVAQRYGATAFVTAANPGTIPVGMTLFDVRELDENQLPLKYNPRKAAEMEAVISGQVVPLVTRGTFLYSGVRSTGSLSYFGTGTGTWSNPVVAGAAAYLGAGGEIASSGTLVIGKFLGTTGAFSTGIFSASDQSAIALVWLNLQ